MYHNSFHVFLDTSVDLFLYFCNTILPEFNAIFKYKDFHV